MMKEWFKARNIWGAAIMALSDAEAGRLAKAIWSYTMGNEEQNLSGAEKGIFAMIQFTLSQDDIKDAEISEKRSKATDSIRKQKISNDIKTDQMISNDDNKNKNKNKNKNIEKEEDIEKETPLKGSKEKAQSRFSPPTVEEVRAYCQERGNSVNPERFVDFYAAKGWRVGNQQMKDWKACVRTWEQRESGNGGNVKPLPVNPAQKYSQRDYTEPSETLEELMRRTGAL